MDCLLIFDHLNDLIYTKYNNKFEEYIKNFAVIQGLLPEDNPECQLNNNVFIQIFSPIVTSHRIMHSQFGNSYTSIQFHDELKLNFIEFMGCLFMSITDDSVKNFLQMCVTFARYLCGPDIYQLQAHPDKSSLLTNLIDQWLTLRHNDQAMFVEAVEQLIVNNDLSATCLQSLKDSVTQLAVHIECSKVHAMLLVEDKFLSLYSSTNAKALSPADILFTIILTHCQSQEPQGSLKSYQVLLAGPEADPKCLPHAIHIVNLFEKVYLVYFVEVGNPIISAVLYETFCHLHTMQFIQIQRDKDTIRLAFENLDLATRKLNDSLKKSKNSSVDSSHKQLMKKWDVIKTKYKEYLKSGSDEAILRAETLALGFLENLKELLNLTSVDDSILNCSGQHVTTVVRKVKKDLEVFSDFFQVKGIKNFSLGSYSLTIYKYMEEFPGLVHFLYVDRNAHRVTTPSLDMTEEKAEFIRKKIWFMISFAHSHLQEGHTSIIWKDMAFTYGYFLWFEDISGAALKSSATSSNITQSPGILSEDFYTKLKSNYFPKMTPNKIRCYELFCMHLGLVTPSCMLEQARRLAATIWELKGFPTHAIDLL